MLRPPQMHTRDRAGSYLSFGMQKNGMWPALLAVGDKKNPFYCELWLRVGDIVRDFQLCRKYFESNWTLTIFFRSF